MGRSMPTPIGHALAGAALALAAWPIARPIALPKTRSHADPPAAGVGLETINTDWTLAALLAGLAAAPDLDLLFQTHRTATHSFVSTAFIIILARLVTGKVTASSGDAWRLAVLCGAAWGSHVLLDWMGADTNRPRGVQALWPFNDRWFISGWDVFHRVERRNPFGAETMIANLKAVALEIAIMLPIATAAWWISRRVRKDPAYE